MSHDHICTAASFVFANTFFSSSNSVTSSNMYCTNVTSSHMYFVFANTFFSSSNSVRIIIIKSNIYCTNVSSSSHLHFVCENNFFSLSNSVTSSHMYCTQCHLITYVRQSAYVIMRHLVQICDISADDVTWVQMMWYEYRWCDISSVLMSHHHNCTLSLQTPASAAPTTTPLTISRLSKKNLRITKKRPALAAPTTTAKPRHH